MEKAAVISPKTKRIIVRSAGILAALLVLLLIAAGISAYVCDRTIKVTDYDVALDGIRNPAKLVLVADLHGKVYGDDNAPLVDKIAACIILEDYLESKRL